MTPPAPRRRPLHPGRRPTPQTAGRSRLPLGVMVLGWILTVCLAVVLAPSVAAASGVAAHTATGQRPTGTGVRTDAVPNLLDPNYQQFSTQKVEWSAALCAGREVPRFQAYECADVQAPLDWDHPGKGSVRLAMYRTALPANAPAPPRLLLANPGGPGADSHLYAQMAVELFHLEATHRAVDVDPRGTGFSTPARCDSADHTVDRDVRRDVADFTREQMLDFGRRISSALRACAEAPGSVLPYLNTQNTAQDLNLVRHLLGYPTADFFGNSYGTWVGSVLGRMFPDTFQRLLFNATVDTTAWSFDQVFDHLYDGVQESFDLTYVPWLARHDQRYHLGTSSPDVHLSLGELREKLHQRGRHTTAFDNLLIQAQVEGPLSYDVFTRAVLNLTRDTPPGRPAADVRHAPPSFHVLPLLHDAESGGPSHPSRPGLSALMASIAPLMAVRCGDVRTTRTLEESADNAQAALVNRPLTARQHLIHMACAQWPYPDALSETVRERPLGKVLMLHNEDDPNAPYRGAVATYLNDARTARLLVVDDSHGHGQGLFEPCLTAPAQHYLRTGELPASRYCQAGPMPQEREVYEHGAAASELMPLPSVLSWPFHTLTHTPPLDHEATRRWQSGHPVPVAPRRLEQAGVSPTSAHLLPWGRRP